MGCKEGGLLQVLATKGDAVVVVVIAAPTEAVAAEVNNPE